MKFFNIPLYNGTYADFFEKMQNVQKPTLVFTPNPEIFYRAHHDADFMKILEKADYNVPDGNGLYVGSMMQKGKSFLGACIKVFFDKKNVYAEHGELIKGSDFTRDILESGTTSPKKVLVIDRKNATPKNDLERKKAEVQKNLKKLLEEKYPGITVLVVFEGEKSDEEIAKIITENNIDFVFSCIGMKIQEERLVKVFEHLPDTQKVVGLGVGASIDFLLGLQKRAPKIFRDSGLEWLYRLITQPKIRYKRIKTALVDFPKLVKEKSSN